MNSMLPRRTVLKGFAGSIAGALLPWTWTPRFEPVQLEQRDTDEFCNPELWLQEALISLHEELIVGRLVHLDYEDVLARHGDVANVQHPGTWRLASRRVDNPAYTPVHTPTTLDHLTIGSLVVKDGEMNHSFEYLAENKIRPCVKLMAKSLEALLVNQLYSQAHYFAHGVLAARQMLNEAKEFPNDRYLIMSKEYSRQFCHFVAAKDCPPSQMGRMLGFDSFVVPGVFDAIAFHRNSIALATRPYLVEKPPGVVSLVMEYQGISMRCTMRYSIDAGGTVVDYEVLAGTAEIGQSALIVC